MPTADFDTTLKTAVAARMQNVGQSCIAAKFSIVAEKTYEQFAFPQFVTRMAALKIGDRSIRRRRWAR